MKSTGLLSLLSLSALLFSCDTAGTYEHAGAAQAETVATAQGHQHSYRCSMNCEKGKTYDQPGKCPVCGMALVHDDGGMDNGLSYQMLYRSKPLQLEAGKEGLLFFTPKVKGNATEIVPLDEVHEKKVHLIVVSEDLSYFEHIHPEYQASGSYDIKVLAEGQPYTAGPGAAETHFRHGGNYVMFADYQPSGGAHQVEKITFKVDGPEKPAVTFSKEQLTATAGEFTVALDVTGGKLKAGEPAHVAGALLKDGQLVDPNTLENFLGAKAHMVVISLKNKEYLHVHPEVINSKFDLNTTFKEPGIYRGWIQFKAKGKVHTVDFTLNVAEGAASPVAGTHAAH
ncbi:heavy metal-binding domain-containing protein [Pontibacter sp. MBLB2868]|uniref:heavy metal-binding domain-containing protein n=1 Tax=Pontibacter sp. MBLB2868 TaxID=3451555 RepID=UPI003F75342A